MDPFDDFDEYPGLDLYDFNYQDYDDPLDDIYDAFDNIYDPWDDSFDTVVDYYNDNILLARDTVPMEELVYSPLESSAQPSFEPDEESDDEETVPPDTEEIGTFSRILCTLDDKYKIPADNEEFRIIAQGAVSIISDAFRKLDQRFHAKIVPSGSFFENLKVLSPDEFDFLAEITSLSKPGVCELVASDRPGFAHVTIVDRQMLEEWKDCISFVCVHQDRIEECRVCKGRPRAQNNATIVLAPEKVQKALRKRINRAMREIELPEGWKHGGYRMPEYSGHRRHGPATLFQFRHESKATRMSYSISLDVTLAIRLNCPINPSKLNFKIIDRLDGMDRNHPMKHIFQTAFSTAPGLHLIPLYSKLHIYTGHFGHKHSWRISCSMVERELFQQFGVTSDADNIPRRCLRLLKILRDEYLTTDRCATQIPRRPRNNRQKTRPKNKERTDRNRKETEITPEIQNDNTSQINTETGEREENLEIERTAKHMVERKEAQMKSETQREEREVNDTQGNKGGFDISRQRNAGRYSTVVAIEGKTGRSDRGNADKIWDLERERGRAMCIQEDRQIAVSNQRLEESGTWRNEALSKVQKKGRVDDSGNDGSANKNDGATGGIPPESTNWRCEKESVCSLHEKKETIPAAENEVNGTSKEGDAAFLARSNETTGRPYNNQRNNSHWLPNLNIEDATSYIENFLKVFPPPPISSPDDCSSIVTTEITTEADLERLKYMELEDRQRLQTNLDDITYAFEDKEVDSMIPNPRLREYHGPKNFVSSIELKTFMLYLMERNPYPDMWDEADVPHIILEVFQRLLDMNKKKKVIRNFFFNIPVCSPLIENRRLLCEEKLTELVKKLNDWKPMIKKDKMFKGYPWE